MKWPDLNRTLTPSSTPAAESPGPSRGRVPLSLKGRALRLLSQREHSRLELERKLAPHAASADELAQALDALQARDFISDTRATASVIYRRSGKLGIARIQHELAGKGLVGPQVQQALAELKTTERERAWAVWQRKFGQPPQTPQESAKQMRFLLTRGFAAEVAQAVVRQRCGGASGADADA